MLRSTRRESAQGPGWSEIFTVFNPLIDFSTLELKRCDNESHGSEAGDEGRILVSHRLDIDLLLICDWT